MTDIEFDKLLISTIVNNPSFLDRISKHLDDITVSYQPAKAIIEIIKECSSELGEYPSSDIIKSIIKKALVADEIGFEALKIMDHKSRPSEIKYVTDTVIDIFKRRKLEQVYSAVNREAFDNCEYDNLYKIIVHAAPMCFLSSGDLYILNTFPFIRPSH